VYARYACVYAFQPCYNTTSFLLQPVCAGVCTSVATNCQLTPDCSTGNATGMVLDASGSTANCYTAAAPLSGRPAAWAAAATAALALALLLLTASPS
jgi:hypothetical protein